jgi:hypothetical protein
MTGVLIKESHRETRHRQREEHCVTMEVDWSDAPTSTKDGQQPSGAGGKASHKELALLAPFLP